MISNKEGLGPKLKNYKKNDFFYNFGSNRANFWQKWSKMTRGRLYHIQGRHYTSKH